MRIYAFYMKPGRTALADAVAVREGFSWGALCFGFLWALYRRLWGEAFFMAALPALAIFIALSEPHAPPELAAALVAMLAVFNACCANEWRCSVLERRGHVLAGIAVGATRAEAERRFFERAAARLSPPPAP